MTIPLPVGPLTPYITPELLTQLPTGVSWRSLIAGRGVPAPQLNAALSTVCATATSMADAYCHQMLRATQDTVQVYAPGPRAWVPQAGLARVRPSKLILTRWPVLSVTGIEVSPNTFPRVFAPVTAGDWDIADPPSGLYGSSAPGNAGEGTQEILLAPGWLDWSSGHEGWVARVTYVNGWPHCGLTASAAAGDATLTVDDCTGWAVTGGPGAAPGAAGVLYDASSQETFQVTAASAASGPGTLTLAAPLTFGHEPGVMGSALPPYVLQATAWYACSIALTRGATATTNREVPGTGQSTGAPKGVQEFAEEAELLLNPLRRII